MRRDRRGLWLVWLVSFFSFLPRNWVWDMLMGWDRRMYWLECGVFEYCDRMAVGYQNGTLSDGVLPE